MLDSLQGSNVPAGYVDPETDVTVSTADLVDGRGVLCGLDSHRVGYIKLTVRIGLIKVDVG